MLFSRVAFSVQIAYWWHEYSAYAGVNCESSTLTSSAQSHNLSYRLCGFLHFKFQLVAQLQPEGSAASSSSNEQQTSISNSNSNSNTDTTSSSSSSSAAQCPFAGATAINSTATANNTATNDTTHDSSSGASSTMHSTYSRVTADGAVAMTECPLGFGSKKNTPSYTGVPRISLQALALHAGGQSDAPLVSSST
jgi:hypothetical protein